jgi:hypothetical protein
LSARLTPPVLVENTFSTAGAIAVIIPHPRPFLLAGSLSPIRRNSVLLSLGGLARSRQKDNI